MRYIDALNFVLWIFFVFPAQIGHESLQTASLKVKIKWPMEEIYQRRKFPKPHTNRVLHKNGLNIRQNTLHTWDFNICHFCERSPGYLYCLLHNILPLGHHSAALNCAIINMCASDFTIASKANINILHSLP